MSYPNAIEVCRADLFTKEIELRDRYPGALVDKVLRVDTVSLSVSDASH